MSGNKKDIGSIKIDLRIRTSAMPDERFNRATMPASPHRRPSVTPVCSEAGCVEHYHAGALGRIRPSIRYMHTFMSDIERFLRGLDI